MRHLLLFLGLAFTLRGQNALYVDISGPWRYQPGDDPRYAEPDFDDRGWRTLALPLPAGGATNQPIPGNPRRYWLRRRIELPAGTDLTRLALTLGAIRDGYQIYVDGQLAASLADLRSLERANLPQPRTFPLPRLNGSSVQLALRVHRYVTLPPQWRLSDEGPYLLTYRDQGPVAPGAAQMRKRYEEVSMNLAFGGFLFCIASLAFAAWWIERSRRDLLWFALAAWTRACVEFQFVMTLDPAAQPLNHAGAPALEVILTSLVWTLLGECAIALFPPPGRTWWRGAVWLVYGLQSAGALGYGRREFFTLDSQFFYSYNVLQGAIVLAVVVLHWLGSSRPPQSRESRLISLALGTLGFFQMEDFARRLAGVPNWIPSTFAAGRYEINRQGLTFAVLAVVILVALIRRTASERRDRQRLAAELEAGRNVQQLMLAGEPASAGLFQIDTVYEPAQEVGGDFHWSRLEPDGSLTVAVGDVSGKGLKAAMLVSVAIGVLQNEKSPSPAAILGALNRGLAGRTAGGFVTCCCARFDPDGQVTLANAGHPSPYRDGQELTADPGLPLGLAADIEYAESTTAAGHFTFISDGVLEAENAQRELFGFERTRAMSSMPAQEIADAAKRWGQNDDITVVTVRRSATE